MRTSTARLVHAPADGDGLIAYCARVSNPTNQNNAETAPRLLRYCAAHGHWSVFEMVSITVEIETPRDIARQMLRHRSLHFQEFSQRYAVPNDWAARELRMQDATNRQKSLPTDDAAAHEEWETDLSRLTATVRELSRKWLDRGAAKEVVRVMYPEGLIMSRLYAHGTVRDWWHYCRVRLGNGTQQEHIELAEAVSAVMRQAVPVSWRALEASCGRI